MRLRAMGSLRIVGILLAVANVDEESWVSLRGRRGFTAILLAFIIRRARLILYISHALIMSFGAYLIVLDLLIDIRLAVADSLLILIGVDLPRASLLVMRLFGHATVSMLLRSCICHRICGLGECQVFLGVA